MTEPHPAAARNRRDLIAEARACRIEDEISRRGIMLNGRGPERTGACPRCGGTDRFAICRGCQRGGDVIALVQQLDGCQFLDAVATLMGQARERRDGARDYGRNSKTDLQPRQGAGGRAEANNIEAYERRQHEKAAWLWSQRRPIAGSIAEKYLREARGYSGALPSTLGFLPPSKPEHHPAMVAAFGMPDEPEPGVVGKLRRVGAVHLTLLKPDGSGKAEVQELKKSKLIVGSTLGLPIVLAPPNDLLGLAITEGIEDALTAHQATGLGAWAAGPAGFMPKLADAVPDYIEAVTIFAHADKAGQEGARALADALELRGIEVRLEGLGA
jgi:putative DNA primase/helicase